MAENKEEKKDVVVIPNDDDELLEDEEEELIEEVDEEEDGDDPDNDEDEESDEEDEADSQDEGGEDEADSQDEGGEDESDSDDAPPSEESVREESDTDKDEENSDSDEKNREDDTPKKKDSTARQVIKCICNYPHWLATSIVHWFTGTEEHPLPFLGLRDRLRCWWLSRHGYAYIRRLSFNRQLLIWEIQEDFDKRRGFPLEAVHCTNEKGVFLLPIDKIKFDPREDYGFGAHNAFNYMKDNSFEEAQMAAGQEKQGIPLKYLGIFAIGAIAVGMYAMTVMG